MGIRGGGLLLYIMETIPAYNVQLQEEAVAMRPHGANKLQYIQQLPLE